VLKNSRLGYFYTQITLTLTLSPQLGRGDWKEFSILKIFENFNFKKSL
jgi:hypothetical protein